jgi:hypothetical protein
MGEDARVADLLQDIGTGFQRNGDTEVENAAAVEVRTVLVIHGLAILAAHAVKA